MNILFVNANLHGHINPTLGLVKKLIQRGHRVDYFCSEPFSETVTGAGAKWIGYSDALNRFLSEYRPTDRHPFFILMEYMLLYDEVVLPEIKNILSKYHYDLILCDSYFGGACFLKQMTRTPVVSSHSSFAMSHTPVPPRMLEPGFHPQLDHCYEVLKRICETHQIETPSLEQVFTSKTDLNIVYTTRSFNGDEGVNEPEYLFTGPSIDRVKEGSDFDLPSSDGKKTIYISLGSINTAFADFYKTCIAAFRDTEYFVFMSVGTKCDMSALGDFPSNFYVKSFLPQLEILKRADGFITHAGFNSVSEALCFGVPMLALPQVNDQHMVAKRINAMNLGVSESMEGMTPEALLSKTEALLFDAEIKSNCTRVSREMRESADLDRAAESLENFACAGNGGE